MSIYEPTKWSNEQEPAISETSLNHLERGTEDAHSEVEEIAIGSVSVYQALATDKARFIYGATQDRIGGIKAHITIDRSSEEYTGFLNSATILGEPASITDLRASDNLPGMIKMTFTETVGTMWYDLFMDGELIATDINSGFRYWTVGGTWTFQVLGNNFSGAGRGVYDSGTAKAIPTEPPAAIDDFKASDRLSSKIVFNWSDHEDAYDFTIYEGTTPVVQDARPGAHIITIEHSGVYHVVARNRLGTTTSNTDEGTALGIIPDAIVDYAASDDLQSLILSTFSYVPQPAAYDLYRDNIMHRPGIRSGTDIPSLGGTWDFKVVARGLDVSRPSNIDVGTALPANYPPSAITDFVASDNDKLNITISFSAATEAGKYDLYVDGAMVAEHVYSGFIFTSPPGTYDMHVIAVNDKGSTESNHDNGTSRYAFTAPPVAIIDFVASDDLTNKVSIFFTPTGDAVRYDLVSEEGMWATDVRPGDVFQAFEGTWLFHIMSINLLGVSHSNTNEGTSNAANSVPAEVTDFNATDTLANRVTITFTPSTNAATQDLYKNDMLVATDVFSNYVHLMPGGGPDDFYIRSINLKGFTNSNHDDGSSIVPTEPPSEILDFMATGDDLSVGALAGEVVMTFSHASGAASYDLWKDNVLETVGVLPGHSWKTAVAGVWTFNIVANNEIGSVPSNDDIGSALEAIAPPIEITTFAASDSYEGLVVMTFPQEAGVAYELFQNGTSVANDIDDAYEFAVPEGTREYYVEGVNAAGTITSNADMGTSEGASNDPGYINNFAATDNSTVNITFTWSNTTNALGYDVYNADKGTKVLDNANSGDSYVPGTYDTDYYYVLALGTENDTKSNYNQG
ncbi:MAG: hypothetical protein DRP93_05590, partial [Candidatus Neomarinimicrobiota bacterium]